MENKRSKTSIKTGIPKQNDDFCSSRAIINCSILLKKQTRQINQGKRKSRGKAIQYDAKRNTNAIMTKESIT